MKRPSHLRQWVKSSFPMLVKLYRRMRYGPIEEVFTDIFRKNIWMDPHSASGVGSSLGQTEVLRTELPLLLKRLGVRAMLDAPSGDFFWMKNVNLDLDQYFGADIVREIVARNQQKYESGKRVFLQRDVTKDALPKAELILCRDCLVHLSFEDIRAALANFRASGAQYLLTTTFTARSDNVDIRTGDWRPLNLQRAPLNFPEPLDLINEKCPAENGNWADKSLGLWRLDQILLS